MEHDDEWRVLDRGQLANDNAGGPDAIIEQLARIGTHATNEWQVTTVGVGIPGLYDPVQGTVGITVNLGFIWNGRALAAPLSQRLGIPVALINDAKAFGLAELTLGAGRGASTMIGVVLGTGVGGVIVLDGHVYTGPRGDAGEIGHMTIDPNGPDCNCGNNGCLEAFVRADRIAQACGAPSVEEAVARAERGDARAIDGLRRSGRYLGIGIANVVLLLVADRVVVGGGVARAGDWLLKPAREEIDRRVRDTPLEGVELVVAELGPWAGAIGAALHGAERVAVSA